MFFCFPGLRWFHKAQKGMPVQNHFTPDIPGTELLPYPAFLQLSAGKAATKMFVTESCWCWARNWRCSATQESALWHRGGGIKAFLCSHSTAGRSTDRYLPAQSSRMRCTSVPLSRKGKAASSSPRQQEAEKEFVPLDAALSGVTVAQIPPVPPLAHGRAHPERCAAALHGWNQTPAAPGVGMCATVTVLKVTNMQETLGSVTLP